MEFYKPVFQLTLLRTKVCAVKSWLPLGDSDVPFFFIGVEAKTQRENHRITVGAIGKASTLLRHL